MGFGSLRIYSCVEDGGAMRHRRRLWDRIIHGYTIMVRKIEVRKGDMVIKERVDVVFEKTITRFGNSAKLDAPKKYIGKRAYVIIVKG